MTESEAILLFKCLADKSRLQILKSLALEDMYVERLAERLNLTPPTISFHLKKLAEAGVEIFSCGTCLNHFGIADKLAVGEVTNMYVIVQKQLEAGVVVRP